MSSASPWDDIDDAPTVQQDTTRRIDLELLRQAQERAANDARLPPPRPMTAAIPPLPPPPAYPYAAVVVPPPRVVHTGTDATPLPVMRSSAPVRHRGLDLHFVARVLAAVAAALAVVLCFVLLMPRRGDLRVEVKGAEDARAEIYVDGIKRCDAAPCVVRDLRPGARTVQVFATGMEAAPVTEVIAPGEQRIAVVALKPAAGAAPRAAQAAPQPAPAPAPSLDASREAVTVVAPSPPQAAPAVATAAPAPQPLALSFPAPETKAPPPAPASTATVSPSPAGNGTLNLNSLPSSKVLVDGRAMGETPRVGVAVPAGKHTVTFIHKDLGKKSVTVTVKPGEATSASVRFKR